MLSGGCYCGYIRYEADGEPFHETICHCSVCRKVAGAPMVAWFTVGYPSFRFTAELPHRYFTLKGWRTCCPRCGTQLTFQADDHQDEIDVTVASLDDPDRIAPKAHTWWASRLAWIPTPDGLKTYDESERAG